MCDGNCYKKLIGHLGRGENISEIALEQLGRGENSSESALGHVGRNDPNFA